MAKEIERKFLIDQDLIDLPDEGKSLKQGYLAIADDVEVRVRLAGDVAKLTIKTRNSGLVRSEFEYVIPVDEIDGLFGMCGSRFVVKTRYKIPIGKNIWEVDIFEGRHSGLALAEVELSSIDQVVTLPKWIGKEVTEDMKYRNAELALQSNISNIRFS